MKVYGSENEHLIPKVQVLFKEHVIEDINAGIYDAYSGLVGLLLRSSVSFSDEDFNHISRFAPAGGVEQPLMARFGRHHEPGAFRLTLSRVDSDNLDILPHSTLTVATIRPVRQFEDIGETFTLDQIELVSMHAMQILAIDGLVATHGLSPSPENPDKLS